MILLIMRLLTELGIKVPHLFSYASTRMIFSAFFTLTLTILLGRSFIQMLYGLKIGHTVRVGEVAALKEMYQKSQDVPSMGGVLFLTTILLSAFLWMDLTHAFTLILVLTTLVMGFLGGLDDYLKITRKKASLGVSSRGKFIIQVVFSGILGLYLLWSPLTNALSVKPPVAKEKEMVTLSTHEYATRYYFPFCKKPFIISGAVGYVAALLLTMFVITGSTNAVNLTDGLDGLATGLVLLVALVLSIFAFLSNNAAVSHYLNILYIEGSGEIGVFLCAVIGACLGFLWFNGYPAQIFMGDTGSLALGGILGVSAVLLRREFLYALVGGVFVIETLSVIIQVLSFRLRNGKRVFKCAPLHHHFELVGWHEAKVVIRFWMLGLMFALIGLATLKIQ
jgi:phospho-N-acetylmuramoyl-pentapeptide-transferase